MDEGFADMFPKHMTATYKLSDLPIAGSHLRSITKKTNIKDEATLLLQFEIPTNTSIDSINAYEGTCVLRLAKESIEEYKNETEKKKAK